MTAFTLKSKASAASSLLAAGIILVSACSDTNHNDQQEHEAPHVQAPATSDQTNAIHRKSKDDALEIIHALFEGAISRSKALIDRTQSFVRKPNEESHALILEAWKDVHQAYNEAQLSRQFRLQHPAFDVENSTQAIHSIQSRIDSFPLLPGYLDSVDGYPHSGLINSELPITIETLLKEHHFSDKAYVTLGLHAFEFLVTGDPDLALTGWKRFELNGDEAQIKAAQRRISYLSLLSQQIHEDITREAQEWLQIEGYYHVALNGLSAESFTAIATQAQDSATLESYIATKPDHLSESEVTAISLAWQALAEAIKPAAAPNPEAIHEHTEP